MRPSSPWLIGFLVFAALCAACGGSAGPAPVTPDGGAAPVRIIRGDPTIAEWFDLTIEGHGLAGVDGRWVRARIGMPDRPPERLASAEGTVREGAFAFSFPDSVQPSLYQRRLLFIDVDGDGACVPGVDRVYGDYRALGGDETLALPDSAPAPDPSGQMYRSPEWQVAADCEVLNQPWPLD